MPKPKALVVILVCLVACSLVACGAAKKPDQPLPVATTPADTTPTGGAPAEEVTAGASRDATQPAAQTRLVDPSDMPPPTPTPGWEPYESALVQAIFPDNMTRRAVCEWGVLGCVGLERYVWVYCAGHLADTGGETRATLPVVMDVTADGQLAGVRLPGEGSDYSRDLAVMFPRAIQLKMEGESFDQLYSSLAQHALDRLRNHPELPPLAAGAPACP